jgi:hypothetical protein
VKGRFLLATLASLCLPEWNGYLYGKHRGLRVRSGISKIHYVEYKMEFGCRTITGSTGGGQVDANATQKTHSSFNKE